MKKRLVCLMIIFSIMGLSPAFLFAVEKRETSAAKEKPAGGLPFNISGVRPIKEDGMVPDGKYKKNPPWVIGIPIGGLGNSWLIQSYEMLKDEAKRNPNIRLVITDAGWDLNVHLANIQDMISQRVDAILMWTLQYGATDKLVKQAQEKGIIVVDSLVPAHPKEPLDNLGFYGSPWSFGNVGGRWLAKELKGKGNIWSLRGPAGFFVDQERYEGAVAAFKGTDIKIVEEIHGDWSYDKAKQGVEALLLTNPKIDGIWSDGGEMSRAAIEVFKENRLKVPPITGESYNGFYRAWKENNVKAMAVYYNADQVLGGFRYIVALLEGRSGLYKHYEHRCGGIYPEDLTKFYRPDLTDSYWSVTNHNISEDLLKRLYKK